MYETRKEFADLNHGRGHCGVSEGMRAQLMKQKRASVVRQHGEFKEKLDRFRSRGGSEQERAELRREHARIRSLVENTDWQMRTDPACEGLEPILDEPIVPSRRLTPREAQFQARYLADQVEAMMSQ